MVKIVTFVFRQTDRQTDRLTDRQTAVLTWCVVR